MKIDLQTRHVLSDVLFRAKKDISEFMLCFVRLFHEDTRCEQLKSFMRDSGLEEIYVELGATDTDSCKFQVTAVAHEDAVLSSDDFAYEIRKIVFTEMKDMLDTSDEYFKQFGVHNPSSKKKFGTFGLDEINGVSSIRPEDQLKFALYLGAKKYYEESFSKTMKMKHAGKKNIILTTMDG